MNASLSRRSFLEKTSLATAATLAFPHVLRSQGGQSPNNKLNIACIGVGGRGTAHVGAFKEENIVAFCDVDEARAANTFKNNPDVPRFRDYRRMFDQLDKSIDAVSIATPDHMHFPIAMVAMALGKHVLAEKPMGQTIAEVRKMAQVAREKKLVTQMGNQGHAGEGIRLLKEWVQAGVLGDVRELHSWTDRPIWPQGVKAPDHSKFVPVVPATLDWDVWLGVAAARAYDPAYLPFNWRGYWDFGTGALGDMGCHMMDAVWALDLKAPTSVEAISVGQNEISAPKASVVTYEFAARGLMPPLKWVWYDGALRPPTPTWIEEGRALPDNGTIIVGSKATVFADANYLSVRIVPEAKMQEMAPALPAKTIPRVPGGNHFMEWVRACKGAGPTPGASFDYAARLTETVLLSNLAVRAGRRIDWDSARMQVTNYPAANKYVTKEYRAGFGV